MTYTMMYTMTYTMMYTMTYTKAYTIGKDFNWADMVLRNTVHPHVPAYHERALPQPGLVCVQYGFTVGNSTVWFCVEVV